MFSDPCIEPHSPTRGPSQPVSSSFPVFLKAVLESGGSRVELAKGVFGGSGQGSRAFGRSPGLRARSQRPGWWGGGLLAVALLGASLSLGCESKPASTQQDEGSEQESAAPEKPAVDRRIAQAMQAAQSAAPAAGAQQATPPADGLLSIEAAEREVPKGAGAVLVLGSPGDEPRVALGGGEAPTTPAELTIGYRSGGSVMPNVALSLGLPTPRQGWPFEVTRAALAAQQPGRLPPGAATMIASLTGSRLVATVSPAGATLPFAAQAKGDPGLAVMLTAAAEQLGGVVLPLPQRAVGAGAYWMVKSREPLSGADALAYRMVRVQEVSPAEVRLQVQVKRYLVERRFSLEGLPEHTVVQFQSEGSGQLTWRVGSALPATGDVSERSVAMLSVSDRPGQPLPLQGEVTASWRLGAAGDVEPSAQRPAPRRR